MTVKRSNPLHSYYFGNLCLEQGKFPEAEKAYLNSLDLGLNKAGLLNNLGIAQKSLGKIRDALASFNNAVVIDPQMYEAYNNIGNIQTRLNNIDEAVKSFRKALDINPYYKDAYNNLGTVWHQLGQTKKAISCYKKAIKLNASYHDAYNNLAVALHNLSKLKEAIKYFQKAISLRPNFAEAYFNLASVYHDMEEPEESVKYALNALAYFPNYQDALHLLIQQYKNLCDWDHVEELLPKLNEMTFDAIKNNYKPGEIPLFDIAYFDDPERNYQVSKLWAESTKKNLPSVYFDTKRKHRGVIRVGYVSSDFRNNVISHQFIDVFKYHDKQNFKIYAYSCGPNDKSYYRRNVEKNSHFRDISQKSYLDAAKMIYEDKIDILVDLNGFTRGAKLEISALHPAPIQAHYLGFPGTMGSDFFDYIITDQIITPPAVAKYYSEKFVYLPDCYQVQSYSRYKKSDLPTTKNSTSSFVFCSFNNNYKITRPIFTSWMNILRQVPNSILWLVKDHLSTQKNLLGEAKKLGIAPERIVFTERLPLDKHLERIKLADLALDTYPYNGGATTSNTLWAGVPVVTLQGKTYLSRMSSSLLTAAGIPQMITKDIKEYEKLAISLAKNREKLQQLKVTLMKNRDIKPLFNTEIFVKNLEKSYLKMWMNYLEEKQPELIKTK